MFITKIAQQTASICIMPDGRLIGYHRGKILVMKESKVLATISIPISFKERFIGWNRYAYRLLRFGVRSAVPLDDNHIILSIGNYLYEVDIEKAKVSKGWYCGAGIRPLIMSNVKGIDDFKDGIYFGGYLINRDKNPVHIYHRVGQDQWEIVYTFPKGAINHVHNVITDSYRQCLWVFTGDFDESAAIWKVTDNFENVERVVCNTQKYRGCVVHALPEGLLYATDAPYADNFIYLMDPQTFETKQLYPLHGSCIYGCQWKNQFVFSSTVEGDGRKPRRWSLFYNGERGVGIKDDYVHLYKGNLQNGFQEIYKEKKDYLSFLFQFGVFKFPYGINNSNVLYFQPVATKKNDMCLMAYLNQEESHEMNENSMCYL